MIFFFSVYHFLTKIVMSTSLLLSGLLFFFFFLMRLKKFIQRIADVLLVSLFYSLPYSIVK